MLAAEVADEVGGIVVAAAARDLGHRGVRIGEQARSQLEPSPLAVGQGAAAQVLTTEGAEMADRNAGCLGDRFVAQCRRQIGVEYLQRALQRGGPGINRCDQSGLNAAQQSQQHATGHRWRGARTMQRNQILHPASHDRILAQIEAGGLRGGRAVPQHAARAPGSRAALIVTQACRHDMDHAYATDVVGAAQIRTQPPADDQDQFMMRMGMKRDVAGMVVCEGATQAGQVDHEILRSTVDSADGWRGGNDIASVTSSGSADGHDPPGAPVMAIPLILDTDPGDDIDDAYAIAFACRHPGIDLRAVTTVYGDTVERSRLARSVLVAGGRGDIPVSAGCAGGLSVRHTKGLDKLTDRSGFNQAGLGRSEADLPPADHRHAADLIIDTVMAGDGDVVVATIGAMTNLAMALVKEPRLRQRIPRIVAMAGEFERGFAEWNIACDPVAAEIVFRSGIPIEVTPWTIGWICTMTQSEVDGFCAGGDALREVVATCTRRWMDAHPGNRPHLYDPVAVAALLDPSLCTWQSGTVTVETNGVATYGFTTLARGEGPHRVQVGVDRDRAMAAILAGISARSSASGHQRPSQASR